MKRIIALIAVMLLASGTARADFLFGNSTLGSNTTYTATNEVGSVYSCSVNDTVHYLVVYCNATGNDLKLGLYSGDGATKLAETASFTAQSGWNKVAVTSPYSVSSGNSYAICVIGSSTVSNQLKRGLTGTGVANVGQVTWPTLLSSVTLLGSNNYNLYAENDVVSTATPTATITPTRTITETQTITPSPTASPFVTPTPTRIPWQPVREADAALSGQPQAICAYQGKIWVTINEMDGKVLEIDPVTLATTRTINLGAGNNLPQSIHGAFGALYTGNPGGSTICRIDASTYTVSTSPNPYGSPNMITDDGSYIYVACQEWTTDLNIVVKLDPATLADVGHIYLGGGNGNPYGICYTGSKFVVGMFTGQKIVVVDAVSTSVLATFDEEVTNGPSDITYYNGYAYSTSWGDGVVWKVDPERLTILTVPLNFYLPGYSWVIYGATNGGGHVWVTDYEAGRLHKIDPRNDRDFAWADCSMNPQGVAYLDGYVYTVDAYNHKIVKVWAGEAYPWPKPSIKSFCYESAMRFFGWLRGALGF